MIVFICILLAILFVMFIGFWFEISSAIDDVKNRVSSIYSTLPCGNWYWETKRDLMDKMNTLESNLTTEIACLATKNNEDIKRLKGDYAVGDILRFDGTRWRVFGKDTLNDGRIRWKLFGENGAEYRIYTDAMPEGLEFLGHRDPSFD